jgi:hypothetical protein
MQARHFSLVLLGALALSFGRTTTTLAGVFGPGAEIQISPAELARLEADKHYVELNGRRKYLVGDMLVSADEIRTKAFEGRAWTGGTIPYIFASPVNQNLSWQQSFTAGCTRWSGVTPNVRCSARVSEKNYVVVRTHVSPRCVSYSETTGMKGGAQTLSIYHDPNFNPNKPIDGCNLASHWFDTGLIAHEIGHVFGLLHEQSRWDRDSYVQFIASNLRDPSDPDQFLQYRIVSSTKGTTYTPYDFNSIMHYRETDFAKAGKKTLIPSECYVGEVDYIGSLGQVTTDDSLEMQHHYGMPIYEMLQQQRDSSCGVARVNPAELKHYCTDLMENCGPGTTGLQYSAVSGGSTWWCPGGFQAVCTGTSGPDRSCCTGGKVPFGVRHRRGSHNCSAGLRKTHLSNWSCGCPYYMINARCSNASFGFNFDAIQSNIDSKDEQRQILGAFTLTIAELSKKEMVSRDLLENFKASLLKDYGRAFYFKALEDSHEDVEDLREDGAISKAKPLTRKKLDAILDANRKIRQSCEAKSNSAVPTNWFDPDCW